MARARGLLVLGAIEKPISAEAVRGMLAKLAEVRSSPKTAPRTLPLSASDLSLALDRRSNHSALPAESEPAHVPRRRF